MCPDAVPCALEAESVLGGPPGSGDHREFHLSALGLGGCSLVEQPQAGSRQAPNGCCFRL